MSPAEREPRILQYWKAVELFSPQKIPRLNLSSRKEPVLRALGERPLPWDRSHWFQDAEAGRKWRFTACCGLCKQARIRAHLEHAFGPDPTSFDGRPDGESCLFALQIAADEVGRELNRRPGIHVGRPIQPGDLETEIERIADSLGVEVYFALA